MTSPIFRGFFFPAMADIVLPSLVLNDDDGPGIDDDHSVSDGEAGDLAEVEDEGEVRLALPDDLSAVVQQVENLLAAFPQCVGSVS